MKDTDKKPIEPKNTETKAIAKPWSREHTLEFLKNNALTDCDPKFILDHLAETIAKFREDTSNQELSTTLNEEAAKAVPIIALHTHYLAAEGVSQRYRGFIIQFTNELIQEYQCKAPSETALAEAVALSYARMLEFSKEFNNALRIDYLSTEKNSYYGMLAKEADRAHRQFTSSLLVLKQLRSPSIEVNIKAKTAFIAQNQQVNATTPDPLANKETL